MYLYSIKQVKNMLDIVENDISSYIDEYIEPCTHHIQTKRVTINGKLRELVLLSNKQKEIKPLIEKQNLIKTYLLDKFPLSDSAFGYRNQRSYFDYLSVHIKQQYFLKLDIKDFFKNIKIDNEHTEKIFDKIIKIDNENEKQSIKYLLSKVMFYSDELPQGYITSPSFSNIYLTEFDLRVSQYCHKNNFLYSRYADDIIISSNTQKLFDNRVITTIQHILNDYDLSLNYKKINFFEDTLIVNGFKVDTEVAMSNKKLKVLTAVLFDLERALKITEIVSFEDIQYTNPYKQFGNIDELLKYLSGMRSFLISSLRTTKGVSKWRKKCSKKIDRIDMLLVEYHNRFF